jgi:hypothetical protein
MNVGWRCFSRGIFVGDAASMAEWSAQQLIGGHGGGRVSSRCIWPAQKLGEVSRLMSNSGVLSAAVACASSE